VRDSVLDSLRALSAERARLDEAELALIDRARQGGSTWSDIAEALGLASRQAAEQRRLRLFTRVVRQQDLDVASPPEIVALRAAVVDLDRRIGADRGWDRRFRRAALARKTLGAAAGADPGALFSLASDALSDLAPGPARGGSPDAAPGSGLPGLLRSAVDRLRAALETATPKG
jgi:hypothetical protein